MADKLYFISLVPGSELREKVRELKLEMKQQFGAAHALKSPAHITLQMPFRRTKENENLMFHALETFAADQNSFKIELDGFDCFKPRVIFIKINNHSPIVRLHKNLNKMLAGELDFKEDELKDEIHPHLTIATRDLTKKSFQKAWPEFKNRSFSESYLADSTTLLKHNGKNWDIYRSFPFRNRSM